MYTHRLMTALTLYQSGTLTLSQAASHAGQSQDTFITTLQRRGIPIREHINLPQQYHAG
ncbi:DUF7317 family protein [Haloquadratum walsbyi]|uniref:Uncharacterized protein n=2 Tax=Haloquadratum walsbyi TaxID=293091 RepID=J7SCC3_HALWD|nr:UPF0175 family protein [Haloquadratum walsbyi]CCC41695.1 uncharacterized protein Hqrw_3963 [Haloquadratum walsbyi C23]CCL97877.1 uncharacterized protein HQ_3435B [Haloquadratum walsbyi DSM 16790]